MIRAEYSDKPFVVDLLIRAFDKNNSVNYALRQGRFRYKHIRRLMNYSFDICWNYGEIYYTPDHNAVALLFYPEKKKFTARNVLRDMYLILTSVKVDKIYAVLRRELLLRKYYPKHLAYLWYLGVEPCFQGQGVGTSLLSEIMLMEDKYHLPIYLETSTLQNVRFYKHLHFEVFEKFTKQCPLYMLKREPENLPSVVLTEKKRAFVPSPQYSN
jgi:ribosomal protein S18 acetylase RimI-like enzyme